MLKFVLLNFAIYLLPSFLCQDPNEIVVETKFGKLKGFQLDLADNKKANIFLGVPFAKPPISELRFEKPLAIKPWKGVKVATKFAPACFPYHHSVLINGKFDAHSEDCLYLNIFAPNWESSDPNGFPVIVLIHGGGFSVGHASAFGYRFLSEKLVKMGFAATGDESFPGNFGLWDQNMALKFLQQILQNFNGDPKRVTLIGHSAGSASVGYHTVSHHSKGLFSQAIELSGSLFAEWACSNRVIQETEKLAAALKCDLADSKSMKKCLKGKSVGEIFDAQKLIGVSRRDYNFIKFTPRLDADFLTDDFPELIKNSRKIPTLIGLTQHESLPFTLLKDFEQANEIGIEKKDFENFGAKDFKSYVAEVVATESEYGTKEAKKVRKEINDFYLNTTEKNPDYKFYLDKYEQLNSDLMFNVPILMEARYKAANSWPVYLYLIDYFNEVVFDKDFPVKGTFHASEYPYLFDMKDFSPTLEFNEEDKKFQDVLFSSFIQFVKTGNPSIKSIKWPRLDEKNPYVYAKLGPKPEIGAILYSDRLLFWHKLRETYEFDAVRGINKITLKTRNEL